MYICGKNVLQVYAFKLDCIILTVTYYYIQKWTFCSLVLIDACVEVSNRISIDSK